MTKYVAEKDSLDYSTNNFVEGLTWIADPEWSHKCAKEILNKLNIPYDVFKMYDVVKILLKYQK